MKIAVIGSINMDIVMKVHRLPEKGETLMASDYRTVPGGKGANQAVAAARLGASVAMIGALGNDAFGDTLLKGFQDEGLNVEGIQRTTGASGNALITVDDQGDNTILVYPGANGDITPQWIHQQEKLIQEADWVMLQLEIPMNCVVAAAKLAKKHGKKVILNPAPAAELPPELYTFLDLLTPNETELALLTGITGSEAGMQELLKRGVKTIVVTLGSKGSMAKNGDGTFTAEPYAIKAVDTTAAGDAFNAGLVVALAEERPLQEALAFANAVGALTATQMGAQHSLPLRGQVDDFMKSYQA
ncbi:ribokinase [Anoxynatronum buryatiense]|uniref:Ribokinase n=1 Tax=Anoxynatronum buryatiense TaxID=489973 RepID=A0AA45WSP0_9CLOT|nr:ribokinase [Anoxynatronum buryatiense]SMP38788.1 ribokinase [Anoxynatronum buryatiense]